MNHIMLDLETLGTRPGCSVISIGAVAFDPGTLTVASDGFYLVVNQKSCEEHGLHVDKGTLGWWMRQSEDAKKVLVESRRGGFPLPDALGMFRDYLSDFKSDVRIWGCGSDFDNAILSHCYVAIGSKQPWKYTSNRCYRTLKSILPSIEMERTGTYHNAFDDAKSQAEHALRIMGRLASALKPE